MDIFKYKVKNQHGETIAGKVEAQSLAQAAAVLRGRGLLVISVKPQSSFTSAKLQEFFGGVKQDEVVTLTRQLSTMITAGLPLIQAMSILAQQSKPSLSHLVSELQREIEGGSTFAKALERFPKQFSRVYIQLVRAGEIGGVLDEVLQRLADNMEKDKEFRAKTRGALIYPAIVVMALVVVAAVMMIFVIPKLTEMYKDFGAELPLPTQILISMSNFSVNYWWIILAGVIGGTVFFKRWVATKAGRHTFDNFKLKIPVFGILVSKIILTEFARTLSLLLGAGISLLQALQIVSGASSNVIFREAMEESARQVEKGVPLSQSLSSYKVFPPILSQMIAVGEETGKLDDVLMKLSKYFEAESENAVKNMTTALEPMIMIVLGIGVGVMVIAVIMPIYNLTSQF